MSRTVSQGEREEEEEKFRSVFGGSVSEWGDERVRGSEQGRGRISFCFWWVSE